MRSFSATNDPDREIGPSARRTVRATRLVSDPWPAVLPRRCRNLSHRVGRFAVFFSKTEPGLRFRSSYPAACSAGRGFDGARFGTAVSGNCRPGRFPSALMLPEPGLAVPFPGDRDGGIVRYGGIGAEYAQRGGRRNRPGEFCRLFHFVTVTE